MPKYTPITIDPPFDTLRGDLLGLKWNGGCVSVYFELLTDPKHVLEVAFDGVCIARVLDEMPLSTEEDNGASEGLVPYHFAYTVEGAKFASSQSIAWLEFAAPVQHYRLLTGFGCVDVLSCVEPTFIYIPRSMATL